MRRRLVCLVLLAGCPSTADEPPEQSASESSYFQRVLQDALQETLHASLRAENVELQDRTEQVRQEGCPALRVTIDEEEVDFPHAYASIDEETGTLEVSVLNGDITSCNGIRLPTKGRNSGLISFREAHSTGSNWTRPKSVIVEELRLKYLLRAQRFSSVKWRGGRQLYQPLGSDSPPVLLSESLTEDVLEVCIPPLKLENTAWKGKDDLRGNRSAMSVKGLVKATMCGPRISADSWRAGEMTCDPLTAAEDGASVEVDTFVDPEQKYGVIGFLRSDKITCESLLEDPEPLFSAHVSFDWTETPTVGVAETNTTDAGSKITNSFFGNSISPLGPRDDGKICLHRPLYWYREGRVGFVRGTLKPKQCPAPDPT